MNTPRLIKWANDGYPPINLNNELRAVIELIKGYKELESKQLHKPDGKTGTNTVVINSARLN